MAKGKGGPRVVPLGDSGCGSWGLTWAMWVRQGDGLWDGKHGVLLGSVVG